MRTERTLERRRNMNDLVRVSKDEFVKFLENYPRKLVVDACGLSDPPLVTYNDFSDGRKWGQDPDSVVAKTFAYSDDPNDYFYEPPEKREYMILKGADYEVD